MIQLIQANLAIQAMLAMLLLGYAAVEAVSSRR
jgi:hypothetical protein